MGAAGSQSAAHEPTTTINESSSDTNVKLGSSERPKIGAIEVNEEDDQVKGD